MNTIVSIGHLEKAYTARKLFDDAAYYIGGGEKLALIGANGTGKSTLLRILAGGESPDGGGLIVRERIEIRSLSQNPQFLTAETTLMACLHVTGGEMSGEDTTIAAKKLPAALGVGDAEAICDTMSGDEKKRVVLADVLLHPTNLLIFDKPINHPDDGTAEWFKNYLGNFRGALLMATHDHYFLGSVCIRTLELNCGELYSYDTDYEDSLALEVGRPDIQQANERVRQNILREELAWI